MKSKILYIIIFILMIILSIKTTKASTLIKEVIPDVWIFRKGGGQSAFSAKYTNYSIDGLTTYCIEPGKHITTDEYINTDSFITSPYSEDVNTKIKLIGYYGYDYPGHDTLKYRMATQALIWEVTGGQTVEYWTEKSGGGTFISVKNEKDEIMRLVNNHPKDANFNMNTTITRVNKEVVFIDDNNSLDNYEVISNSDIVRIEDNKVIVLPKMVGEYEILLKRRSYTDQLTTLFIGEDNESQKMGFFGFNEEDKIVLKVKAELNAKIKVTKIDDDTKEIIKNGSFVFKIKNRDTSEYVCDKTCEFKTTNGYFITPFYLEKGNYILEEVQNHYDGYLWNKDELSFSIDEDSELLEDDDYILEIYFSNKKVMGELEIFKVGEDINGDIPLDKVSFGLYALEDIYSNDELIYKKNDLVQEFKTKNGYYKINNLFLGKYYLKELATLDNYILDEKETSISIDYVDENTGIVKVNVTLKNYLKKGSFELTKIDSITGNAISGVKFDIYNDKLELIYSGITNEEGKIIVNNLPLGKYTYIESDAPKDYYQDNEYHYFEIKDDDELVKDVVANERIPVPNTLSNEIKYSYFSILGILLGLIIIYDKKDNRNSFYNW